MGRRTPFPFSEARSVTNAIRRNNPVPKPQATPAAPQETQQSAPQPKQAASEDRSPQQAEPSIEQRNYSQDIQRSRDQAMVSYTRPQNQQSVDTRLAPIGSLKRGGRVKKSGLYRLHRGEVASRGRRR